MRSFAELRRRGAAGLVFAVVAIAPPRAERIAVAPESVVDGASVRLGDVAALEGERSQKLAGLVLAPAPAPGESRSLAGSRVLAALQRELGALDAVRYTIPALVRVRRASQDVTDEMLRETVERFLVEQFADGVREARLRSLELPGVVRIPPGPFEARVAVPPGGAVVGRTRLQVELLQDGTVVRTVWVTADVALEGPVVVARRPIGRGETIAAADLTVERREIPANGGDLLGDPHEAEGRVARAALPPLAPLRREQLTAPILVRRGDVVLLVAERGGLRLTVPAEAQDEAAAGESVRVTNRATKKDVIARVVDQRTVRVDF
jgi:flagella basal body P-ring formation protein FlgA